MKARIGKAYDRKNKKDFYQLQFKLNGERTYKGFSYDIFERESEAKKALAKHINGELKYTYYTSIKYVKNTVKGNHVSSKDILVCHVMGAKPNLPSSRIWFEIKND